MKEDTEVGSRPFTRHRLDTVPGQLTVDRDGEADLFAAREQSDGCFSVLGHGSSVNV